MENFEYHTPTRLIFGKGIIDRLPEVMRPIGNKVLLAYGGASIKRLGLYDKVKELLKDFEIHELGGIEPNPKYNPSVLDGQRICKEKQIDVILSVGGGSVLDCCKAIAAAARYEGDPWDLISYKVKAEDALPIVDVMTLAATGSEYDCGGVISRTETNDKIGYVDPLLYPVCSLLDPAYTETVNAKHTAAGVADAINHAMEQFFVNPSLGCRRFLRNADQNPDEVRSRRFGSSRRLRSPRRNHACLHFRLQRAAQSGGRHVGMAHARHRACVIGLLRHHAR